MTTKSQSTISPEGKNRQTPEQLDLLGSLSLEVQAGQEAATPPKAASGSPPAHQRRRNDHRLPEGEVLKEEGMERAREAFDVQRWRQAFVETVEMLAREGAPFTSEDVTAIVGLPRDTQQNRNSAVGAMMNGLARRGVIRKTGQRVKSTRPQSHSAEILEWVGAGDPQ